MKSKNWGDVMDKAVSNFSKVEPCDQAQPEDMQQQLLNLI